MQFPFLNLISKSSSSNHIPVSCHCYRWVRTGPRRFSLGIIIIVLLLFGVMPSMFPLPNVFGWTGDITILSNGTIQSTAVNPPIQRVGNLYTLTGDIDTTGAAITVRRENAVLDGKQYTIHGDVALSGVGVTIAANNVTVRNMMVDNFDTGILFGEDTDQWPGINSSTATGNFITGCNTGIRCVRTGFGPPFPLPGGKDERINGNRLVNNTYAIHIFTSGSTISDNAISDNDEGIIDEHNNGGADLAGLGDKGSNIISGNNLTNNSVGIKLLGCRGETVSQNYIRANTGHGILLGPEGQYHDFSLVCSNNTLSGNTIIENDEDGIFLYGASSNTIEYNIIRANNGDGIGLQHYFNDFSYGGESRWENSTGNIIRGNSIVSSQGCGIFSNSSGNLIYHNNFLDNTPQVIPGGESNTWDNSYPSGGNYWSNYVDTDNYGGLLQDLLGSDGICDHRYIIAIGNRDNYPLMSMSFSDEFSATINDRWMWTNQPQNWQVSSGWLVITPALGTNFWSGVESGQFLCQLMSGNFMIQTKVSATLSTSYQQAGLMIWQDANNWVKTNFEYSGGLTIKTGTNRNGAASVEKATTLSLGTSLVWLRVVKNGDYFVASYSLNGSTWIQHYSWTQTLHGYLMVGLCVADGDSGVAFQTSFDYFRYSNLVPYTFAKVIDAISYPVSALSNSEIAGFSINQSAKMISFNITGATGTSGFCNLTIPRVLLGEPYTVQIDGSYVSPIVMSNSTHTSIYLTYVHSTHVVQIVGATIVAEFTTIASNILVMAVLALVLFLAKRKMAAVDLHKAQ